MSLDEYKLSCELLGHSLDVRSVTEGRTCIISGSRDKTAKIWTNDGSSYYEGVTLKDHTNFVSVVFFLEPEGWICTGSNDATVCIYSFDCVVPFLVLKEHTSTVCCIAQGLESKTLITGSWDKTARVWNISSENRTAQSILLEGHDAAVWAVNTIKSGRYVTGSADKNIFVWNIKGEKVRVLKGHTDCVRGLIGLDNGYLLSCGNDATIKVWNEDGECVNELFGHGNYIYTIALNKNLGQDIFVTGSEDSTIRMWNAKTGALGNCITLPAQSVWSVACLRNGDIVTGTSDGIVRVFTKDATRVANEEALKAFYESVKARKQAQSKELGGIKVNDLQGPESLLVEGTEGQTRIVRQPDGKILCYQWTNGNWTCVGDVTGASGGSQESSGKKLFEGKEYDYVFSVDISDTEPPIKLPYNRGQDPWLEAQKFIHKNNLPQVYLDQVANFIIKNSDNTPVLSTGSTGYADPFTGESRYVPGSGENGADDFGNSGQNVDPFTGASSYSSQSPATQPVQVNFRNKNKLINSGKHFPYNKYMTFDVADIEKILNKLRSFNNEKAVEGYSQVPNVVLEQAIKLVNSKETPDASFVNSLQILLKWPRDILFPVLDVARLAVLEQDTCSQIGSTTFLNLIIDNVNDSAPNQLMAIRCLANMLSHGWGRGLVESRLQDIINHISNIKSGNVNLQVAIGTLFLNLTISQIEMADADSCKLIAEGILEFLQWSSDMEAAYRSFQALGNLTCTPTGSVTVAQISSIEFVVEKIKYYSAEQAPLGYEKLSDCAKDLAALL